MSTINAPFTEEQVNNLNDYQKSGMFHPFTCCSHESSTTCKRRLSNEARYKKEQEYLKQDIEWLKQEVGKINADYAIDVYAIDWKNWQLANILAAIDIPFTNENEGLLVATTEGWVCPCGEYKQDWAHEFMANPPQHRRDFTI